MLKVLMFYCLLILTGLSFLVGLLYFASGVFIGCWIVGVFSSMGALAFAISMHYNQKK